MIPSEKVPTDQASPADVAVTAYRMLSAVPSLGLDATVQLVPSHCSIRVWRVPVWLFKLYAPTVHTSFAAAPDTLKSVSPIVPTFGLGTIFQLLPSHSSISVRGWPLS